MNADKLADFFENHRFGKIALILSIVIVSAAACVLYECRDGGAIVDIRYISPLAEAGSWGFIDKTGKYVIPQQFDYGGEFKNGIARLHMGHCAEDICINKNGKVLKCSPASAAPLYMSDFWRLGQFFNDVAAVELKEIADIIELDRKGGADTHSGTKGRANTVERRFALINRAGRVLKGLPGEPLNYDFSEGLLAVHAPQLVGFINTKGDLVIDSQFESAEDFSEGMAPVARLESKHEVWGFINRDGKLVIPYAFRSPAKFHDGLALVKTIAGEEGFIDKAGKMVFQGTLGTHYQEFSEGLAHFYSKNNQGFIDKNGKVAFIFKGQAAGNPFKEGLRLTAINGRVGYLNSSGQWVIPPKFRSGFDFSEGLAAVCDYTDEKAKKQEEESQRVRNIKGHHHWWQPDVKPYVDHDVL